VGLFVGEWTLLYALSFLRRVIPGGLIHGWINAAIDACALFLPNILAYYAVYAISYIPNNVSVTAKVSAVYIVVLIAAWLLALFLNRIYIKFSSVFAVTSYLLLAALFYGGYWAYPRYIACYLHDFWCVEEPAQ